MITFLLLLLLLLFVIVYIKQIAEIIIVVGIIVGIYYWLRHWDSKRKASNIKALHFSHKTIWTIAGILFVLFLIGNIGGNSSSNTNHPHTHTQKVYHHVKKQVSHKISPKPTKPKRKKPAKKAKPKKRPKQHMTLGAPQYVEGEKAYAEVNNGQSTLSNHWSYDHIHYSNLDNLNRTGTATAYLDGDNVTNDSLRQEQYVEPTGWHQKKYDGEYLLNRGHEIAYSLSRGITNSGKYSGSDDAGDQNNLRNLFTQTQFSNQKVQTIFESEVRDALESGEKVIYQVTPIFHGDNLMASGVHMQACSTDGSLNFNVYLYNTQPGVNFNYSDGTSNVNSSQFTYHPYQENNYQHHYSYGGHWSPATRARWRRTMYLRYWRYR